MSARCAAGTTALVWSVVALLAWIAFGLLAYAVIVKGALTAMDVPILAWFAARRTTTMTAVGQLVSVTGGPSATSVYAAILIALCLVRRQLATAVGVSVIVYGAAWLNVIVKNFAQRARPSTGDPVVTLLTYSFPSGHAAASAVFGGLLIVFIARARAPLGPRRTAIAAIVIWVAGVCASRVYLGAHYPTDVLGGLLEAVGWIMISTAVLDRLHIPVAWPSRSA